MRGLDLTLLHGRKLQAKNSEAGVISFHCLSIFFFLVEKLSAVG